MTAIADEEVIETEGHTLRTVTSVSTLATDSSATHRELTRTDWIESKSTNEPEHTVEWSIDRFLATAQNRTSRCLTTFDRRAFTWIDDAQRTTASTSTASRGATVTSVTGICGATVTIATDGIATASCTTVDITGCVATRTALANCACAIGTGSSSTIGLRLATIAIRTVATVAGQTGSSARGIATSCITAITGIRFSHGIGTHTHSIGCGVATIATVGIAGDSHTAIATVTAVASITTGSITSSCATAITTSAITAVAVAADTPAAVAGCIAAADQHATSGIAAECTATGTGPSRRITGDRMTTECIAANTITSSVTGIHDDRRGIATDDITDRSITGAIAAAVGQTAATIATISAIAAVGNRWGEQVTCTDIDTSETTVRAIATRRRTTDRHTKNAALHDLGCTIGVTTKDRHAIDRNIWTAFRQVATRQVVVPTNTVAASCTTAVTDRTRDCRATDTKTALGTTALHAIWQETDITGGITGESTDRVGTGSDTTQAVPAIANTGTTGGTTALTAIATVGAIGCDSFTTLAIATVATKGIGKRIVTMVRNRRFGNSIATIATAGVAADGDTTITSISTIATGTSIGITARSVAAVATDTNTARTITSYSSTTGTGCITDADRRYARGRTGNTGTTLTVASRRSASLRIATDCVATDTAAAGVPTTDHDTDRVTTDYITSLRTREALATGFSDDFTAAITTTIGVTAVGVAAVTTITAIGNTEAISEAGVAGIRAAIGAVTTVTDTTSTFTEVWIRGTTKRDRE